MIVLVLQRMKSKWRTRSRKSDAAIPTSMVTWINAVAVGMGRNGAIKEAELIGLGEQLTKCEVC